MITIKFKYDIGEPVEIIELERSGRVCSLWYGDRGPLYEIAYFDSSGERKKEYLFESEIRLPDKKSEKVGFVQ
jgi:hypothetical protein